MHAACVFSLDPNLPGYIGIPNADAQVQTPNEKNHCFLTMSDQLTHFTGGVHDELDRAAPYPPRLSNGRGQVATGRVLTVRIPDHAESGSVVFALSDR